jgi:nucleoid DNA-binding protein
MLICGHTGYTIIGFGIVNKIGGIFGMKKADLIKAAKEGWPDAEKMVNSVFKAINCALVKGETVTIYNFGEFSVAESKVRTGWDFKNNKRIPIAGRLKVRFKPSPSILKIINNNNIARGFDDVERSNI